MKVVRAIQLPALPELRASGTRQQHIGWSRRVVAALHLPVRASMIIAWVIGSVAPALPKTPAAPSMEGNSTALRMAEAEIDEELMAQVVILITARQFEEAKVLAERGLAIAERQHGRDSPFAGIWLLQLGRIARELGHYDEAARHLGRAYAIFVEGLGHDSNGTAASLESLGLVYLDQGRLAEAERVLKEALPLYERLYGRESGAVARVLALLAKTHRAQGRLTDAGLALERVVAIRERVLGPEHEDTATALHNLGEIYWEQGRLIEAEQSLRRALAVSENVLGPEHPATASSLDGLGVIYAQQGRLAEAESLIKRALTIREKLGPEDAGTATSLNNLAAVYLAAGRWDEAEPLLKRALEVREMQAGPDHQDTILALNNLAKIYLHAGRFSEAEPIIQRAVASAEKKLGSNHRVTALCLSTLAEVRANQGRADDAGRLWRRAVTIYERTLGERHAETALAQAGLAALYADQSRFAEAEGLLSRILATQEQVLAPEHPDIAQTLNDLGVVNWHIGRHEKAESLLRRALAIRTRVLPAKHFEIGLSEFWLSTVLLGRGRPEEALAAANNALDILARRRSRAISTELRGGVRETLAYEAVFLQKMRAAHAVARAKPQSEAALRAEGLEAAQLASFNEASGAVTRMAASFGARQDGLAGLLREQQELLDQAVALDRLISIALGSSESRTRADALRSAANAIAARLEVIDRTLRRDHGSYGDLADPKPLTVAEMQSLLGDDEAIVILIVGGEDGFVFGVSRSQVHWSMTSTGALELEIAALRRQLDPGQWGASMMPFDRALAHKLYQALWAPLEGVLKGKTQVFVVATGPLTSLPLSVLVTEPPVGGPAGDADPKTLRETAWLAKRHALITLPSVSSLKALRLYANKGSGSEPFAGFGDPALGGLAQSPFTAGARSVASVFLGQSPDLNALKTLTPLPGTAGELKSLARALGASERDVYLRERATEAQVKTLDLSRKRVIAFATHGLMAGDMGLGEPGLVFTPPGTASERDDGYLAASEAARLNLRADWIILSACNTAAGDTPGASGLSGLARAFFLAGAKSLLVSHWSVWDDAAQRMTTTTVKNFQANPRLGRAEALREASLALMADSATPRFAHPAAWAPFVLVGETRAN